jgi:transposase InsO family protein
MGSVGDAYDNAMCESFFATLECELLDRRRFETQAEARTDAANPDARQPAAVLPAVKDKPSGRPPSGPSLTAAARDGRIIVRAGTEEWLRQGRTKNATKQESKMPSDQIP